MGGQVGIRIPCARGIQVVLRSIHIASMALVLGGLAHGGTYETLRISIYVTILSGIFLFLVDLSRGCLVITQGSGMAAFLKLLLLGLGNMFPESRLHYYLAATFVASVGSHMSGNWRHFSFLTWKVVVKED